MFRKPIHFSFSRNLSLRRQFNQTDKQILHKRFFSPPSSFLQFQRQRQLQFNVNNSSHRNHFSQSAVTKSTMPPSNEAKQQVKDGGAQDHEVEGEHNEWKFKEPYKVHEKDSKFKALYDGECHCGRVKYQLGREKPLNAKFCHCTTCQVLHGLCSFLHPFYCFQFVIGLSLKLRLEWIRLGIGFEFGGIWWRRKADVM